VTFPDSLPAAAVFLLFLAPGLLFELGLARRLTYLRRPLADRILQFVAWSMLLNALLLPVSAYVVRNVPDEVRSWDGGDWLLAWSAGLAATAGPFLAGGFVARSKGRLKGWVLGADPAPLAWHRLWETMADASDAYVRVRLRESGTWVAGRFVYSSDEPADILLSPRIRCDPVTGELLLDADGRLQTVAWYALVTCDDIDRLEAQDHP
jgi:hypothetical protein